MHCQAIYAAQVSIGTLTFYHMAQLEIQLLQFTSNQEMPRQPTLFKQNHPIPQHFK